MIEITEQVELDDVQVEQLIRREVLRLFPDRDISKHIVTAERRHIIVLKKKEDKDVG